MKKALFCFVIIAFFATQVSAQVPVGNTYSGFYTRFDAGYAFPHAADNYGGGWPLSGTEAYTVATGVTTIDYSKASYSSGLNLNLGAGYMVNPHIGVDLGFRVGVAPKKYVFDYSETFPGGTFVSSTTTRFNTPLYIMPSIVISTGANRPFNVYTRMGIALPLGGKLTETYMSTDDFLDELYDEEEEYDFYMSKGLQGALGVNYGVNNTLRIYGEVNGMSMTRFAKSSEVVLSKTNGVDDLATWTPAQRTTLYDPRYTYDPMTSATAPFQTSTFGIPASNFGITVGAQLNLGSNMNYMDTLGLHVPGGIYTRLGFGYSLPHAGNYTNGSRYGGNPISGTELFNTSTGVRTVDINKASYSSGVTGVVAGGYMVNPHLGFELGIGIGVAPKKYQSTYEQADSMGNISLDHVYESYARRSVNIMPAIVVSTGSNDPFNVYGRAGLVLPIGGKMTGITTITNHMTNDVIVEEEMFDFYMSKGLQGALGGTYKLSDNLGLFAELNGTSLTRYTKSSEIIAYTINGTDQLSTLTTDQRETQYEYQSTFDPAANTATQPGKEPVQTIPNSSWGVVFGASLRF